MQIDERKMNKSLTKSQRASVRDMKSQHEDILLELKSCKIVSLSAYNEVKKVVQYCDLLLEQDRQTSKVETK